jgi:hypothetical protein
MSINVIQHDDRLWYLRPFYNGSFSIVSNHDFDNQFFFARDSTIPAKKFRPPFSCHFTKIGYSLTFIVIMIDVCKLKFEIYYCHP